MPGTSESTVTAEPDPIPDWALVLAALAVGVIAGLGAVAFRALIGAIHNLLFLGQLSPHYDANVHTAASPLGPWIIAVPVAGALGVAWLVKTFAPEAKGHGVPEVLDAIHYSDGKIRPVVAIVKSLASALSIGSGGSVGREGPIIQIGSTFGSVLGQWVPMPVRQRVILIAAGAGGGIAATFDTPIGGILFAMELMLVSIMPLSLMCVGISCVCATAIGRYFFGDFPPFNIPSIAQVEGSATAVSALPWFLAFGLLMGATAWLMTRSIYWFEDLFDGMPGNYYTRHMSGMLLVGLMMYGFMSYSNALLGQPDHYYVQGVGYATLMDILSGGLRAAGFLLLLAVGKFLATCLTLGSGASGGVFSPSMFIGASLGAGVSLLMNALIPGLELNPVHFAIAGMAAMVGATTGAALTATIMTFEMTRDYTIILPVILTVVVATAVRQAMLPATIYTLKLYRRGHQVPQGLQAWYSERKSRHIMSDKFQIGRTEVAGKDESLLLAQASESALILLDADHQIVAISGPWCDYSFTQGDSTNFITVAADDSASAVLRRLRQSNARAAVVLPDTAPGNSEQTTILGIITEREIAQLTDKDARFFE